MVFQDKTKCEDIIFRLNVFHFNYPDSRKMSGRVSLHSYPRLPFSGTYIAAGLM